ncbi:uncharacterized protein N7518_003112 [Penicillium psychrosexuale]|uniref:uncharacterized protein n=1 Tax=Penicillium psychrosexuale TaxID=1002107 RepID=UPI00254547B2|nr:uncharacterized protein N7518_003112 [Penicillium psychrosexuale]KAJ5801044.1 hypothetical protein N7518_003112 [Penicillium psychrosexuale]
MDNQEYNLLLGDNSGTLMPWSAKPRRRIHPGGEGDEIGMRCPLGLCFSGRVPPGEEWRQDLRDPEGPSEGDPSGTHFEISPADLA